MNTDAPAAGAAAAAAAPAAASAAASAAAKVATTAPAVVKTVQLRHRSKGRALSKRGPSRP